MQWKPEIFALIATIPTYQLYPTPLKFQKDTQNSHVFENRYSFQAIIFSIYVKIWRRTHNYSIETCIYSDVPLMCSFPHQLSTTHNMSYAPCYPNIQHVPYLPYRMNLRLRIMDRNSSRKYCKQHKIIHLT